MVDAPASIPASALATQPASKQPVTKALSAQQNLDMQLKPQEDTQQVGSETIHTCKLQAGLHVSILCMFDGCHSWMFSFMVPRRNIAKAHRGQGLKALIPAEPISCERLQH